MKCEFIEEVFQEPVHREFISTSTPEWTRYDYQHTPSETYRALPTNVIVSLETPKWMLPVHPNLVRLQPHWLIPSTQQCMCPSMEEKPVEAWEKMKKKGT